MKTTSYRPPFCLSWPYRRVRRPSTKTFPATNVAARTACRRTDGNRHHRPRRQPGHRNGLYLETPGFAYDRVPVKGIVVSNGASASVGIGDVLNFSNPERRARITVTSQSGHTRSTGGSISKPTIRSSSAHGASSMSRRRATSGSAASATELDDAGTSSGEFGTYGLPEYDDRVTITLGEISDNELPERSSIRPATTGHTAISGCLRPLQRR